jgi:peptide/nickel transport system substrate-binding protein
MKRRLAVPIALVTVGTAALVLGFASRSASGSGSRSGTRVLIPLLRIAAVSPYKTLDPAFTDGCGSPACSMIFEHLQQLSPQGKMEPALATSVTRPSPVTYVYHLRRGVVFWDGTALTSADVANSINYQRRPKFTSSDGLKPVKSVAAVDRYTVRVTLKYADADWPSEVALELPIFEKKFQEAHPTTFGKPGTLVMATGPWQVDSFDPTSGLELSANPHWWGGPVDIKHISIKFLADENSEALAMRAGAIDIVSGVQDARAFAGTAGSAVHVISAPSTYTIGVFTFNVKVAPWNDVHVRRAVAYAINRSDIITALGGQARPLSTLIVPSQLRMLGSQAQVGALLKSVPQYPFNLAKATQELAQSAYPHGFTAKVDTISSYGFSLGTQAVAGELGKIGIKLTVDNVPDSKYFAELFGARTYGSLGYYTSGWPDPDPSGFPSYMLGSANAKPGGLNTENYDPPAVDKLIAAASAAQSPAKRLALYGRLLRRLGSDVPYVPLVLTDYSFALSPKFSFPELRQYGEFAIFGHWPLLIKSN